MKKNIPKNYYSTNTEIAEKFGVSEGAVRNWIKGAKEGRNNLQLIQEGKRFYIKDNEHNNLVLFRLAEKGKVHKMSSSRKVTSPKKEFYEIFNKEQIIEIIYNLKQNQIPVKFTYFDMGADYWNSYVNGNSRLYTDELKGLETIRASIEYIKIRLRAFKKVNVLDIGTGNGLPIKLLLTELKKAGFELTYSAFDISSSMLKILEKNLNNWFPDMKKHFTQTDIEHNNLRTHTFELHGGNLNSANLLLFLGSTVGNSNERDSILKNIKNSMSENDFLLLDAEIKSKNDFKLVTKYLVLEPIKGLDMWVLNKLNLEDCLELSIEYLDDIDAVCHIFIFDKDVELKFEVEGVTYKVCYRKKDKLLGHFVHSFTKKEVLELVKNSGLRLTLMSEFPDRSEVFMMCER
jgi:SAM-dependent methyltransferase